MNPKEALDRVIRKSRVHFYKPIQVAEILYRDRIEGTLDLADLESYRNVSKRWRDAVSARLIGRVSTSSQKFQDNLFEANAVPPEVLVALGEINRTQPGLVEAYIYRSLATKLASVGNVRSYLSTATADSFSLPHFESRFVTDAGLRRSVDKMYEIVVYALFSTLVRALRAEVTVRVANADRRILQDFAGFLTTVLGLDADHAERTFPAALYRVGVTNAADRGLDIWANFGPAVQVKHLTLTADLVEDITGQITADRIVVVCRDAEREPIDALLAQVGWSDRLQGILTLHDLDQWYRLSLSPAYRDDLGRLLLSDLLREFDAEFPSCELLAPFLEERGYADIPLTGAWAA